MVFKLSSSSTSKRGLPNKALAIAKRCLCPLESKQFVHTLLALFGNEIL